MKTPDIRNRFIKPSLDPQKLIHFLSVYDTGSFSAAAGLNEVSQQAVSKSVARLEDGLGVRLFDRGTFRADPTNFGHALARRAKVIIAESRLAAAELSALRGSNKGYVRIGLSWSFIPRLAPMIAMRFKQRQPDVTLSITTGDTKSLHDKLLRGEVEFVASAPSPEMQIDETLETTELFVEEDELVVRRDHPLCSQSQVSLEDLRHWPWLIALNLTERWQRICNAFLLQGLEPPANYVDLDSVALVKAMVLQSDGIAVLARELVSQDHERDLFHFIEHEAFSFGRTAILASRRASTLQPLAQSVRQDLIYCCRHVIDPDRLRGVTCLTM